MGFHISRDFHVDCSRLNHVEPNKTVILLIVFFCMTDLTDDIVNIRSKISGAIVVADSYYSMEM